MPLTALKLCNVADLYDCNAFENAGLNAGFTKEAVCKKNDKLLQEN